MTRYGTMPQAGEVVLIPFPYTDLAAIKRQPVLVLRAPIAGRLLAVAVISQSGHENAIVLKSDDFRTGTLPKTNYIRITKIYTLNQHIVVRHFGALTSGAPLARAQTAICRMLGCER